MRMIKMLDDNTIDWILTVGINDGDLYRNVTEPAINELVKQKINGAYKETKAFLQFLKPVDETINTLKKLACSDEDVGERLPYKISMESKIRLMKEFLNYYQEEINYKVNNPRLI
jgi:hypothetical protein